LRLRRRSAGSPSPPTLRYPFEVPSLPLPERARERDLVKPPVPGHVERTDIFRSRAKYSLFRYIVFRSGKSSTVKRCSGRPTYRGEATARFFCCASTRGQVRFFASRGSTSFRSRAYGVATCRRGINR
jgi:hypothetical protein